ncbi:hypothetical protein [Aquibacillus rhizosphaerae]|uniref:DUF4083 domain-containing protein n=1 Tax=Aquibacillus rhizosphaerae TaxID=3051431 RepID=A0ABT7L4F7_9BACI|nr:hypothetical protein [Aquibacillus sp. LR5S19]MDL4839481.1 hypothetical protein [Aquibacillus sp. LR5S19]
MEIIIGYLLGGVVFLLVVISFFKMVSYRMKKSNRELIERVTNLENRIEDLENK